MSISFPKTFTSERLDAQDLRSNLKAMKDKQQKLTPSDVETNAKWVDTQHIMKGRYTTTTNITENVSGTFGGRNNGSLRNRTSYCSRWLSTSDITTLEGKTVIPYSSITIDVLRPCTIFFQYSMVHQSRNDGDGTRGKTIITPGLQAQFVIGDSIEQIIVEQEEGSNNNVLIDGTHTTNGVVIQQVSSILSQPYNIGLYCSSTAGMCQNISWAISLECFYI